MPDLKKLKQRGKYLLQRAISKAAMLRYRKSPLVRVMFGKGDQVAIYDDIRRNGTVVPVGLPTGSGAAWCTATHRNVGAVLRSDSFGHTLKAVDGEAQAAVGRAAGPYPTGPDGQRLAQPLGPPAMIAIDPPEHTRQRRLIARAFAPRTIESLRPRVREIADELIDNFDTADTTDFVGQFASVLPVMVIAELLGIRSSDQAWFRAKGYSLARTLDAGVTLKEAEDAHQALIELNEYFAREIAARRAEPRGDVLSALVAPDEIGDTLTDHEALSTALLLLVAGFETTVNLLGSAMALLADRPDVVKEIAGDRSLIANTIEEVLRYESPVQLTSRMAREATTVDGVEVKAGESVIVLLAGANRDPEVFEDPHRFDIHRTNARDHLAFAYGAHVCIGAALARMEGQVALDALLDRFESFRLDGKPVRRPSRLLRGYNKLPIKFNERALAPAG